MPRSKTGLKRKKIALEDLQNAMIEVLQGSSIRITAQKFKIPRSTLHNHVLKSKKNETTVVSMSNLATNLVFSPEEEKQLFEYLSKAAYLHFGLTTVAVRKLAFQFAETMDLKNIPHSWLTNRQAGRGWLRYFVKRWPNLSLRKPEPTSLARATSFNYENITLFFNNYKEILKRYNFGPEKIYNVDETGNSTVHKPSKVLAPKNIRQLGSLTSGERGVNVTMISCINAVGNSVPPMMIFPRKFFKEHMLNGGPNGCVGGANPSGWSNEVLFNIFLDHFIKHTKPNISDPILLIMDNHESHISVQIIQKARENGIILLTLHPHTSHKMQPLDTGVFGPFKKYYNQAIEEFMLTRPGKPVTIYDMAKLIGKAYEKAFTIQNIKSGFKVSGIWPVNSDIFNEIDFLQSYVTDRPQEMTGEQLQIEIASNPPTSNQSTSQEMNSSIISLETMFPFPKAEKRKPINRGRKRGKSRILTDTPEKNEVLAQSYKKDKKLMSSKTIKVLTDDIVVNCFKCKRLLKKENGLKCDKCTKYYHEACIPKSHRENIPDKEDEDTFLCHNCYNVSNDSDSSEIDSDDLLALCNNKKM